MMTDDELNRLMFLTIDNIRPLGSPRVNMYQKNDRYAEPPFFRFYFSKTAKDHPVYASISSAVSSFSGQLPWAFVSWDDNKNFFILPQVFRPYLGQSYQFSMSYLSGIFGMEGYRQLIDQALADIPVLAEEVANTHRAAQ